MLSKKYFGRFPKNSESLFSTARVVTAIGVLACGFVCLAGCPSDDKAEAVSEENVQKSEKITEAEDALLGKRDALFNMRRNLQTKRESLADQRITVRNSGGDTSTIDDQALALRKEEQELAVQEKEVHQLLISSMRERRQMMAEISGGGGDSNIAGREAGLASRERTLARREKELAGREAALARREVGLASKWKDSCAGGVSTQTIIRTVDVPGTNYSKRDVEPLLSKARREMSKKGLLSSDLPDQAKGLEKEANSAMKKGDYSRARLASSQLVKTVKAIRVDRNFIAGKIARLNRRMSGKSLSKRTEGLFREATASYGDGKFSSANRKLNQIYSSLR